MKYLKDFVAAFIMSALVFFGVIGMASPALAAPGDMKAATFLAKAEKLKARGPLALVSSDFSLLKNEVKGGVADYRARNKREKAAGKPSSCIPPRGKAGVDVNKLLTLLRSYSPAQREEITMRRVMADYFIKHYPCK